jgi:hypothetical protein
MMSDRCHLLSDEEVIAFIIRGYHLVEADFPSGFNEAIVAELDQLEENPGDAILDRVPKLHTVAITHYDIWHAATANRSDRTRYMLKFLFSHGSEPTAPNWDHDPGKAASLLGRFTFERACTCSQSDHYKERGLRREMWQHLLGQTAEAVA